MMLQLFSLEVEVAFPNQVHTYIPQALQATLMGELAFNWSPHYYVVLCFHMGGYQNYGPLLGPLNRCRIIPRTKKGTMILTTTHMLH